MSLDTALRRTTQQVMRAVGTSVTLRRIIPATYDTATGTMTPTETNVTVKGRLSDYRDRELSDTVRAGDRKLEIAAADVAVAPTVDDKVLIGTAVYDIVRVQTELAKDLPALYAIQLRR